VACFYDERCTAEKWELLTLGPPLGYESRCFEGQKTKFLLNPASIQILHLALLNPLTSGGL
jgi:hypothetical protein